jgi:hypothetical protein
MRGFKAAMAAVSLSAAITGVSVAVAMPATAAPRPSCTQGYPPAQSTVALGRSRADVGMRISYEARCFKPNERVRATVFSKPVVVDTTRANSTGRVSDGFRVPNVPAGRHTLELRGLESGIVQTARFEVRGKAGNGNASTRGNDDSSLAFTGSDIAKTGGAGALLLFGGGALVMAAKRRKHVNAAA